MSAPADILSRYYTARCSRGFSLAPAQGGGVNTVNHLVTLTGDTAPAFVLKGEVEPATPAAEAALKDKAEQHSRVAQVEPLVPAILPAESGAWGVKADDWWWRLLEFRSGHSYTGTVNEQQSAAAGLGSLHQRIRSLPGSSPIPATYDLLSDSEKTELRRSLAGPGGETDFGRLAKSILDEVLDEATAAVRKLEANPSLQTSWVHRDFHPGNALFSADKLVAILDLDSLATDLRMQAVAFAASRFCAPGDTHSIWNFLTSYHRVDPLQFEEAMLYTDFVQREALRRMNWILRVNLLGGQNLWRGDLPKQLTNWSVAKNARAKFSSTGKSYRW